MSNAFQIASALCLSILFCSVGLSRPEEEPPWGQSVDGLQMSVTSTGEHVQVAFRNASDHDLTLNLGITLANGKAQLPDKIKLALTDAQGNTRVFRFFDRRYPGIAGRADPYVVPLPAGSIYTLQFTFDQFCCTETGEYGIHLLPGTNGLTARFDGSRANSMNRDMMGVSLMSFWLGTVESNTLSVQR